MKDKPIKIRVIKEHKSIAHIWPLNYETELKVVRWEKDTPGFFGTHSAGTIKHFTFVGANGSEYDTDLIYQWTGTTFTEFVKKI